jgi:hypothetical protein
MLHRVVVGVASLPELYIPHGLNLSTEISLLNLSLYL